MTDLEILKPFIEHRWKCAFLVANNIATGEPLPCDCGLDKALAQVAAAHYFKDVICTEIIKGEPRPYKRRELYLAFKGKYLLYGWCNAGCLRGIWEPENPWGHYADRKLP